MGCGKSKHAIATENTLVKSKSKGKSVETNNNTTTIDGNVHENLVQETGENKIVKENEIHADVIDKDEGRVEPLPEEKPKEAEKIADGNVIKKIDEDNEEKLEAVASSVAEAVDESKHEVLINGEKKDDVGVDHVEKEHTVSHDFPVKDESALEANSDKEKEEAIEVDECKETESSVYEKVPASDETESSVEEKVPASDETESSVEEKVPASGKTESSEEEKVPAAKDENVDADSTTAEKAN
ncbi:hypothetical protein ACP275_07G018500 [Erythranthe tilingii]